MIKITTTGLVERSTFRNAHIPWEITEFESHSSSPKDLFINISFFLFFLGGGGGEGWGLGWGVKNGKSTIFGYQ